MLSENHSGVPAWRRLRCRGRDIMDKPGFPLPAIRSQLVNPGNSINPSAVGRGIYSSSNQQDSISRRFPVRLVHGFPTADDRPVGRSPTRSVPPIGRENTGRSAWLNLSGPSSEFPPFNNTPFHGGGSRAKHGGLLRGLGGHNVGSINGGGQGQIQSRLPHFSSSGLAIKDQQMHPKIPSNPSNSSFYESPSQSGPSTGAAQAFSLLSLQSAHTSPSPSRPQNTHKIRGHSDHVRNHPKVGVGLAPPRAYSMSTAVGSRLNGPGAATGTGGFRSSSPFANFHAQLRLDAGLDRPPPSLNPPLAAQRSVIPSLSAIPSLAGSIAGSKMSQRESKAEVKSKEEMETKGVGSKPVGPVVKELTPLHPPCVTPKDVEMGVQGFLLEISVGDRAEKILRRISPNQESELRRSTVVRCIHELIKRHSRGQGHRSRNGNVQVYPHGSFASKTYLPCSTVDVAAYFVTKFDKKRGEYKKNFWAQQVAQALSQTDRQVGVQGESSVEEVSVSQDTVFNTQVLHCVVNGIGVRVCLNRVDVLESLSLVETVDITVGSDHLLKRTILLFKAWAKYEAGILGTKLLSGYAAQRIVLTIFNGFYDEIKSPIQGFYKTISYLAAFDWHKHALGINGPIKLSALPTKVVMAEQAPCSFEKGKPLRISEELLNKYTTARRKVDTKSTSVSPNTEKDIKFATLNIIETAEGEFFTNLTEDVPFVNANRIIDCFQRAAKLFQNLHIAAKANHSTSSSLTLFENGVEELFAKTYKKFDPSVLPSLNRSRSRSLPATVGNHPPAQADYRAVQSPSASLRGKWGDSKRIARGGLKQVSGRKSDGAVPIGSGAAYDPLATNLETIQQSLAHAKQFQSPCNITEMQLVAVIAVVLDQHGKLPIGALGRMIRTAFNSFSLPQVIQDCGGIKAFLMRHNYVFVLGENHPNNPLVHLNKSGISRGNGEVSKDPLIATMVNKVVSQNGGSIPLPHTSNSSSSKKNPNGHGLGGREVPSKNFNGHNPQSTQAKRWHGRRRGRPMKAPNGRTWGPSGGGQGYGKNRQFHDIRHKA